ncbi:MAG TPA: BPTI/Kunitz domain-containing protein [Polyangiaceae bacterium]|jgi:hypothetical protein
MRGNRSSLGTRRCVGSFICAVALSGFVACGGNAVVDGSASAAGASSVAGASATAGTAGASADPACTSAQDSGECDAYVPAFWHNPKTGLCEPFVYGGCGGNANRYPSRDACIQACPAVREDWGECANDSNCTLIRASCVCELCEPVAIEQLVAVNLGHVALYGNSHCTGEVPCVDCPPVPEDEQTEKYFKPVCQNARCTLIDIRESPLSECRSGSDCVLRDGASCCEECDGSGWVPVNKRADFCGGVPTACDGCAPPPAQHLLAVCVAGKCALEGPI